MVRRFLKGSKVSAGQRGACFNGLSPPRDWLTANWIIMKPVTKFLALALTVLSLAATQALALSYSVVHDFGVLTNVSGTHLYSAAVAGPDGTLYGAAYGTEGSVRSTLFKIRPDGTGFTPLKWFTNAVDGYNLYGQLLLVSNTLYGTGEHGGDQGYGTVFAIHTDGSGFTNLHNFSYDLDNGRGPFAGLVRSGGSLFGTTYSGGSNNEGTVFRLNTDGTGYTNLYSFGALQSQTNHDGAIPRSLLVLSGNTLYGTAYQGGSAGNGTVFAINTDGSGFTNLHTFNALVSNTNSDGARPFAGLIRSGNRLFGAASGGGSGGNGTLFAMNTDGTGFTNLHSFTYADGGYPYAPLLLSDDTLYGTTYNGGQYGQGTVFAINTNGTGFTNVYSFTGDPTDGANPNGSVVVFGGTLFGATDYGGTANLGTLFRVNPDGSAFTNLFSFNYGSPNIPYGGVAESDGKLYGTTYLGGRSGVGVVFRVNSDGSDYTNLHQFASRPDGANPESGVIVSGNTLYGTTSSAGRSYAGTIFRMNTDGSGYTNLFNFTYYATGAYPYAGLAMSGNRLYGTTYAGGGNGNGTVFAINTDGTGFTNLHVFSGRTSNTNGDGAYLYGGVIVSNGWVFGMTYAGGSTGNGTVFRINTDGGGFTNLHNFSQLVSNTNQDGAHPDYATLVLSGSRLYGTTYNGGATDSGVLFAMNTDGTDFTVLHNFSYGPGNAANPLGALLFSGGMLYGTTTYGGDQGKGAVFRINTDGSGYTNLYSFDPGTGANPYAGLTLSGSTFYGTTSAGGEVSDGVVFALKLATAPIPLNIQLMGGNAILDWSDPSFSLQSAPAVTGVYTNVSGASSPYTNAATSPQQFFRLLGN